jgi:hypothetical protein
MKSRNTVPDARRLAVQAVGDTCYLSACTRVRYGCVRFGRGLITNTWSPRTSGTARIRQDRRRHRRTSLRPFLRDGAGHCSFRRRTAPELRPSRLRRKTDMNTNHKRKRTLAGVLLSAGVALAGVVLAEGTAYALPGGPVPLSAWPGCPEDNPSGPCHWCPGDPPGDIVKTCG